MRQQRIQRDALPTVPRQCRLFKPCPYREGGICSDARTNKGNSDAACHRLSNKALLPFLFGVRADSQPLEDSPMNKGRCAETRQIEAAYMRGGWDAVDAYVRQKLANTPT